MDVVLVASALARVVAQSRRSQRNLRVAAHVANVRHLAVAQNQRMDVVLVASALALVAVPSKKRKHRNLLHQS